MNGERGANDEQRFTGAIGGEDYDLFALACPDHSQQQRELAKQLAHLSPNAAVLELGTGTGYTTRKLLEATGAYITTIDTDERMLECAQRNLYDDIRRNRVAVYDADSFWRRREKLTFSAFAQAFTLHNLPADARGELLAKIADKVEQGGTIAMLDKIARDEPAAHTKDLKEQIAAFSVYDRIGRPELREEWTQHYHEDNQPDRVWKESDALQQLRDLGFPNVRVVERYGMHALITGTKS